MKRQGNKFLNIILAFGMLFIAAGFLLIIAFAGKAGILASYTWPPLLFFIAGFLILYWYMAVSRSAFRLFIGMSLTFYGVFSLLVANGFIPFSMNEWWPVIVLFTGISLLVSARTKCKGIVISYDLPGVVLIILGLNFMLFSLELVKISFRSAAVILCPVHLILAGIFLVILFLYRKSHSKMFPSDDPEENGDGMFSNDDDSQGEIL